MSTYCFIVNPAARKGKGKRLLGPLQRQIEHKGVDAEIHLTEKSGHAKEIAARSAAPIQIAVGGDGTVNEVANAIIGTDKVLAVIPNGSGNDLIKSLEIPVSFDAAFDCLVEGRTAIIDTATVSCSKGEAAEEQTNSPPRYFVNGVGIGFDAAVAERIGSIKYLGGFALYIAAVFQTLGRYRAPCFRIRMEPEEQLGSRKLLIAVGNGRCAGGGFYLTPAAQVDDGLLDVCLIDELTVPQILALMPKVMKGRHGNDSAVRLTTVRKLHVEASEPFYVHADGEIVGRGVNRVDIAIHQLSLKVIVGEKFRNAKQ